MGLKERLQGHRKVKINGTKYVIKKINPLLDFSLDTMPQIFTSFISRRKVDEAKIAESLNPQKALKDMMAVVEAGLVSPFEDEGIEIQDIFRDMDTATRLYIEILSHTLNQFKGLKRLFFSLKIRRLLRIAWRELMASSPRR